MNIGLVCDACNAFNALEAATCCGCNGALSLDGSTPEDRSATLVGDQYSQVNSQGSAQTTQTCTSCGSEMPIANRFCGACGAPAQEKAKSPQKQRPAPRVEARPVHQEQDPRKQTMYFSSIQAAKAKLVLIKGEGHDGESYSLAGQDHRVGRLQGDVLFQDDPFLSPTHANFFYESGKLIVRDENSTNGVFIRIRGSHQLELGNRFLVGEQIIMIRDAPNIGQRQAMADGTHLYTSPRRPARFELLQILHGGAMGLTLLAQSDVVSLGREENDMNFPDDPFISGHHAQVSLENGELRLTDLGSKNGTFLRITKDTQLEHGDYVFMGQQLLRVEIV